MALLSTQLIFPILCPPITGRLLPTPTVAAYAWCVNFGSGVVHDGYKSYSDYVRAVRGGQ